MNPDAPKTPQEEMETRLIALLLGELPEAEAAAWSAAISSNPELAKLHDRLSQTISLVREATAKATEPASEQTAPLQLSEERREKLLAHFKTVRPAEFTPVRHQLKSWLVPLAATAALVFFLGVMTIPNSFRSRSASQANSIINNLRQLDSAKQQWALEHGKSDSDVPTFADIKDYVKGRGESGAMPPAVSDETYILGSVGEPVVAEVDARLAKRRPSLLNIVGEQRVRLSAEDATDAGQRIYPQHVVGYVNKSLESTVDFNVAANPLSPPPAAQTAAGKPLFDSDNPLVSSPASTREGRGPSVTFANTAAPRPEAAAPATPAPQIVLPSTVESESLGVAEVPRVEVKLNSLRDDSSLDVRRGSVVEGKKDGVASAAEENQRRMFYERYGIPMGKDKGVSTAVPQTGAPVPSEAGVSVRGFYGDMDRTPAATPLPAGGSAVNGAEQLAFAGRGISPETGLPVPAEAPVPEAAALGQTLAVTPAVPAFKSRYGLGSASRESGVRAGGSGGGGAGATYYGGAFVAPQTTPGQAAAGDVVAGFAVTPAPDVGGVSPSAPPPLAGAPASWSAAQSAALNQPAQTGADTAKLPVLGDVPALGVLYQTEVSGRFEKLPSDSLTAFTPESVSLKDEESLRRQSVIVLPSVEQVGEALAKSTERGRKAEEGRALVEAVKPADAAGNTFGAMWADYDNDGYLDLFIRTNGLDSKRAGGEVDPTWKRSRQLAQERDAEARVLSVEPQPQVQAAQKKVDELRELDRVEREVSGRQLAEQAQELLPAGAIDFAAADVKQALTVYSKLTGKSVLQPPNLPSAPITLKAERPLTKREAIQALDAALAKNGISMINVGDKFVKALPVSTANAAGAAISSAGVPHVEADLAVRKPATNAPIPQPEIQASENAFSTFSLNVSDVSFKLAAASLEKGQMPDPASIRSEEFINAFDYRDPEPPLGMPVAFAWERARYPFAHNRDLLRFSLKTGAVGRQAGRALNLVLLLDNSGSMERADRVHIIREALRVLAGQLQPQDKISVITFARTPRLWVDGAPGSDAGAVAMAASELTPQGGTNLEEAMNLAYQTALRHYLAGGINRVVVLTDGAANLGNVQPESLKQKVEAHRKQGVALDCFGIGWEGFNDDLLEVLSRNGDGRYGFINSPEEAATEFAGQLAGALQVAASDVKVQVEFNPARVTSYRQMGYAKHQLTKEQFRDNTVDAAEIAAQEAGNALYTVEVNPAGEGPLCIVRVRFKFPGTVVYREHEWAVPYNGNAVSLEQASPAMRLATSASAFSEWLVASPFAAEVTPDALLGYLSGVPEVYGADARPKKLEWMIRQAKSIEGK
jgi:Mg-chelatase subunit ChlD